MSIRDATPADAPAIARVHVDSWRATYRGLMPDDLLAGLSYERRVRQWAHAATRAGEGRGCLVVLDEGEAGIVGFADGGDCRGEWGYDGELFAIYLAESHQGRGLGKALFFAIAERLAAQGKRSMLLWVLDTNALGRGFYEALGGVLVGEQTEVWDGATLREVSYGWPDLTALLAQTRGT
jgi:ribosomal protein S18 acetylase RimI-like enzyme